MRGRSTAVLLALTLATVPLEAAVTAAETLLPQTQGTISGTVTDARTGAPIASAQVSIVGTQVGALSNQQGQYRIEGVPAGEVTVRAQRIGMTTVEHVMTVGAGLTATVDFQLSQTALDLDEIVVTGTAGGTQRRAIGNVVAAVNVDAVMARSPIVTSTSCCRSARPG